MVGVKVSVGLGLLVDVKIGEFVSLGVNRGVDGRGWIGARTVMADGVSGIAWEVMVPGRVQANITKITDKETSNIFFINLFYNYYRKIVHPVYIL